MRDYKKYKIWEMSHSISLSIYELASKFPKSERFGLISQMRRAAYSIPSNIAEGCGRESNNEFMRFLVIARGSATELDYFLILTKDLTYISQEEFLVISDKVNHTIRSINNLILKLKKIE